VSASLGDQTSAGQALIVWMRRDNDKRPSFQHLTQRTEWKRMGGAQEFAGRHRHRSCAPTGFQTPNILPPTLLRNQTDLLVVSIAKHELERIDMPFE
jgi:hypothetical protein